MGINNTSSSFTFECRDAEASVGPQRAAYYMGPKNDTFSYSYKSVPSTI